VRRRHLIPVLVAGVGAFLLATAIATATATGSAGKPSAYVARVTKLCNSFTPKLDRLNSLMLQAEKRNETYAYGVALAQTLVVGLAQDTMLRAIPVPVSLASKIDPVLGRLRQIDGHVVSAIDDGKRQDASAYLSQLKAVGRLAAPLNGEFDRVGLRACGSDQK